MHETDAIQLALNELLDAADSIAADGLVQAGFRLLAIVGCPSLMHPSNRASIASYVYSRGLTLVFASIRPEPLRPRALDNAIFPHTSDQATTCTARSLADASGNSGWNDPRTMLSMDTAADVGDDEAARRGGSFQPRLRNLRVRFAHACMHRRPLSLAPTVRARTHQQPPAGAGLPVDIERTLMLATLTNRMALVLHASPLNASSENAAQRHPVRVGVGVQDLHVWVRHLAEPSSSSAAVSALLLINKGRTLATARLPSDATLPFSSKQLYVLPAWGNTSAHSATGVPPGTPLTAIMNSIDVPPFDAVLYLLFATPSAAQLFELDGARVRGASTGGWTGEAGAGKGGRRERGGQSGVRAGRNGGRRHDATLSKPAHEEWSPDASTTVIACLAAVASLIGFCFVLRRVKQQRDAKRSTQWDHYGGGVHARLCAESPNDRPGTESKRKGRGRGTRPRLPFTWEPPDVTPAAASPPMASPPSDDCYRNGTRQLSPIPFNLRSLADACDAISIGTRRGFACSASFQDIGEARAPPAAGFDVPTGIEEENAPHRRTPRHDKTTCFGV